jgi:hypothetical protein
MPGSLTDLELAGIRLDQEAELDATCIIWRQINDESRVISKVDATFAQTFTQTIFTGPCFCAPIVSRRDRFDVHNEQQVYQNQYRVLIPYNAGASEGGVKIGDFLRITVGS